MTSSPVRFRLVPCLFVVMSVASLAMAQMGQYGQPQRVSVEDLIRTPGVYNERAVIVRGELRTGTMDDISSNVYALRGSQLRDLRVGMPWGTTQDLRFSIGQRVEISGIFFDLSATLQPSRHPVLRNYPGAVPATQDAFGMNQLFLTGINVDNIDLDDAMMDSLKGEEEEGDVHDPDITVSDSDVVDLRDLVESPLMYLDRRIAVLGKFRGNNLYSDLSIRDKRTPRDFVIKVADTAVWVTGKRPRGKDFKLDPKKRRDTGKWLRIIGKPWLYEETLYFKAEKISLAEKPENPDLEPVAVDANKEKELGPPPEITFSLPLDGERSLALDLEVIQVQFSKDMNESSFNGNVDLLYVDDDGQGNPFPDLELSYDQFSRTLNVRPNQRLEPSTELWLILYVGVEDSEGQGLVELPGASEEAMEGLAVLKFYTTR